MAGDYAFIDLSKNDLKNKKLDLKVSQKKDKYKIVKIDHVLTLKKHTQTILMYDLRRGKIIYQSGSKKDGKPIKNMLKLLKNNRSDIKMDKFIIDYQTGVTHEFIGDLQGAKAEAAANISYTQQSIYIYNDKGDILAHSRWYGVAPEKDNLVLETIGGGFYQLWTDDIINM